MKASTCKIKYKKKNEVKTILVRCLQTNKNKTKPNKSSNLRMQELSIDIKKNRDTESIKYDYSRNFPKILKIPNTPDHRRNTLHHSAVKISKNIYL